MRHAHAFAASGRTPVRVISGVVSLLVLAGALGGLPLLLAWATPVVWAATHDDLAHLLDRQDTGAAFLALLLVVGWTGWAQFAFCAVRELVAQLRGRTWRVPCGFGASQRAAAALIGSILVLLSTSSALASDANAATTATTTRLPGQANERPVTEQVKAGSGTSSATTVHIVQAGESLWSIAEQHLGDGERWREIAALNEGHAMADGQVFQSNSFLRAGWQLQMPLDDTSPGGDRTQLTATAAADDGEANVHVVTVDRGDYLSKIAQEELGDSDEWPTLFAATRGKPQPDGLPTITDPDVIYAGQQISVPEARTPDEERHTPPADSTPSDEAHSKPSTPPATPAPQHKQQPDADSPEGQAQPPAPGQTATPAPQSSAAGPTQQPSPDTGAPGVGPEQDASTSPAATPSAPAKPSSSADFSPTPSASSPSAPAPAGSPLSLRMVLGAGALLAAAITGALALRRTLQRRRRKPGEKIAITAETSTAEAKLAAAAEPGGAARLDLALRTMAYQVVQRHDHATLPHLRAARIGTHTLQVLSADFTQSPPTPFVSGESSWWTLPADADLLSKEDAREVSAPYPALVTIGRNQGGDLVLLNLAQLPALLLDGNPVHLTEVCTSLALELGMSPWAADVEIIVIGFGEDLPQLLPTTRIAYMRQPQHALRDLSERLLEAHQMPDTVRQPYLLLCAATLDADTAWQFAEVIGKAGTMPITLVAPASTAAPYFPEAEIFNASLTRPQHVDIIGADIRVQRLEHAAYQQITTALKVSGQPAEEAEGPWQDVPQENDLHAAAPREPDRADQPTGTDTADAGSTPAPAPSPDTAFPALLAAATADPSGLRILPHPPSRSANDDQAEPDEGAVPPPPTTPTPTRNGPEEPPHPAADQQTQDMTAPEIRVLGPIEVDQVGRTGHGPRIAQIAALLYFRPGRDADTLCEAMDPISPWSTSTLNARLQGLRRSLGNNTDGQPYVPRRSTGEDPYRLARSVRCDWSRFVRLAERALPLGPAGLTDLEKALTLVRGKPFGGKPLPWAEPLAQEMTTRIIDIAHTVATYRTPAGPHQDLDKARQAVATALEVDDAAELIYRDWLRLEHVAGNRPGLHTAISRVQQINRDLDCSPEPETEHLINELLNSRTSRNDNH
ncbi:LysM peptidoglycan-binding domain-containing protein [Streptomyces toyocaensis]|uniref:LysM peptidoglycan-binding domain-containing protein n=1 Tax=Streptomyces toyocaensis TaxID=55952 RepID=UPI003401A945